MKMRHEEQSPPVWRALFFVTHCEPAMTRSAPVSQLAVTAAESGMKLLRFLERRIAAAVPRSALHKWIRTGQVRINGSRARPHSRLEEGDWVRLPPFVPVRPLQEDNADAAVLPALPLSAVREKNPPQEVEEKGEGRTLLALDCNLGPRLGIVAEKHGILALSKPGGLACQAGSGQTDSVAARLATAFAGRPFLPAPAHRLDRYTSGLLLAGTCYAAQRHLHELFQSGKIGKEYLAWVKGVWQQELPCLLEDVLRKSAASGREKMAVAPETSATIVQGLPEAVEARKPDASLCVVAPVQRLAARELPQPLAGVPGATLLLVRLLTGRKHQIRVQLASRGFPLIGDGRYHGPHFFPLLLHAWALEIPLSTGNNALAAQGGPGKEKGGEHILALSLLPDWSAPFAPDPGALEKARILLQETLSIPSL